MAKLLIILFSPPESQNTDTAYALSKAAVELGHGVTIFCDVDATYTLVAKQTTADKIAELIKLGIHIHACRESARLRGIDAKTAIIEGVVESSLGRLAEMMEQHDRVISF